MSFSAGLASFKLIYEISPIIFVGGIANNIPFGMLPIIAITEAVSFTAGLLSGGQNIGLDDFFAHWRPLPGATIAEYEIGKYPFANQSVAANAIIAQPLTLSMLMICPARDELGYPLKLVTMTALKSAVDQHCALGGTFTICTPSFIGTNYLLKRISDASLGESRQPQNAWQWDFEAPLLTLNAAQQVQSGLMAQLTNGTQVQGQPSWSGFSPTVGNPNTLAGNVLPSGSGLAGTFTSPQTPIVAP